MDLGIKIVLVLSLVRSWGRRRHRRRLKDGRLFSFFNSPCSYIFTVASLQPFLHSLSLFVDISTSLYLSLPLPLPPLHYCWEKIKRFSLATLLFRCLSLSFVERIAVSRRARLILVSECAPNSSERSSSSSLPMSEENERSKKLSSRMSNLSTLALHRALHWSDLPQ